MSNFDAAKQAGSVLRHLIQSHYPSQEEFAYDFGTDIRTVSRYVNQGINKISAVQELAEFFGVPFTSFFESVE